MSIGFNEWLCMICGARGMGPLPREHMRMEWHYVRGEWWENGGGI